MAEELFHVPGVFCFMVYLCSFPVPECVEGDSVKSWVLQFESEALSHFRVCCFVTSY